MKKTKIFYWIFTGLFAALMLFTSVPDILNSPDAVDFMTNKLGYPPYFTPFIGVAKVLGVIAILIPVSPDPASWPARIKEWAYAGLMFDLVGAAYSVISLGEPSGALFMLLPVTLCVCSYLFYHKMNAEARQAKVA